MEALVVLGALPRCWFVGVGSCWLGFKLSNMTPGSPAQRTGGEKRRKV